MVKRFKTSKRSRLAFLHRLVDLFGEYRVNLYNCGEHDWDEDNFGLDFGDENICEFNTNCLDIAAILKEIDRIELEKEI